MDCRTDHDVLVHGLELVGFSGAEERINTAIEKGSSLNKFHRRFRSHYKADPSVYAAVWEDLQTTDIEDAKIEVTNHSSFDYFMMTIYFLACYDTEERMASRFGGISEETVRTWVWYFLPRIQALQFDKIIWPDYWNPDKSPHDEETIFIITVDGVHCPIEEPPHEKYSKNTDAWSHKYNKAGLAYEIGMSIFEQKCVWMNGPFFDNDIRIFRESLKNAMPKGKLAVADRGYRGEPDLITVPSSLDTPAVRQLKKDALSRHENFNNRIKAYDAMKTLWRHGIAKHQLAFEAVVVLSQYQLENGSPLFEV